MYFLLLSTITGAYAAVSFVYTLLNTPDPLELIGTDKDPIVGISLHSPEARSYPPMYIGSQVIIPVGVTIEYPQIFSVFHSTMLPANVDRICTFKNYILPLVEPTCCSVSFVNTINELHKLEQRYSISETRNFVAFPPCFPMKAKEYRWPTRVYVDGISRCIGTSRNMVKLEAYFARRLPLSGTAAVMCVCVFGASKMYS